MCVIPSQEEPVIVVRIPTTAANAKMVLREDYNSDWDDLAPETFRDKVAKLLGTIVIILWCLFILIIIIICIFSS